MDYIKLYDDSLSNQAGLKARANFWYPPKAELQGAKFVR